MASIELPDPTLLEIYTAGLAGLVDTQDDEIRWYPNPSHVYPGKIYITILDISANIFIYKIYLENFGLYATIPCKGNAWHGLYRRWHPNGRLAAIVPFVHNKAHGRTKEYYQNGQIAVRKYYKKGKLHGVASEWDRAGNLMRKITFREGNKIGTQLF